jgi:hypothetical protein
MANRSRTEHRDTLRAVLVREGERLMSMELMATWVSKMPRVLRRELPKQRREVAQLEEEWRKCQTSAT